MHFHALRTAAVLLSLAAALPQARADDAATCRQAHGDDVVAACGRLIARSPNDPAAWFGRASAYARQRQPDLAIADFDQAIRLDPRFVDAYVSRGMAWNVKGEYDRAVADYDEALRLAPRRAMVYNRRATAWFFKGAYDRAVADFDQAIRLDPKLLVAYFGRGNTFLHTGEFGRAMATYDEAVAVDPAAAAVYYRRGDAYAIQEQYDRAIADFDKAIALDPRTAFSYAGRCGAWNGKGEYDRALADCEEAIRLEPRLAVSYSYRGFAYGKKGDIDRALVDLDKAIALAPRVARAYSQRGAIYELQGDLGRAIADYDDALKLNAALPEARRGRDRVQKALTERPALATPVTARPLAVAPDRRVALVIGNSQYRSAAFLPNPRRDAAAVADALRQVGFETVELVQDVDRDGMVKALRAFRSQADQADWALVYFAGHGIEIEHSNYVIPTDARLVDDRDVKTEAISYEELLSTVANARQLRLVVLDACRTNPFKDQMRRSGATRGDTGRGLAPPPESKAGTLVVYAAKEGEVAADDAGGANSPFAAALVAELKAPGVEVRRVFDNVRDDVLEATDNRQQPFTYGSLPGRRDFYFVAGK
jgi:tetratricopeptide (TPR) repeat protein